jgi:ABC-type amino acid transport substrate-binding protein
VFDAALELIAPPGVIMRVTKFVLGALSALLISGCAMTARDTDGTLEKIKDSGTLNLGYRESAPPFSFPGPDRRPVGYSVDLCTHVAGAIQKQLGVDLKLNWVPVTAEDRIDMVVDGKVDLECSTTTASLSRQERVEFSLMTFVDGGSLLTKADSTLGGVPDLAGKRIAVIPGTTTETALTKFLKDQFVTVEFVHVKDHLQGLAALDKGEVEAFASDRGILIGIAVTSRDPARYGLANVLFSYEPYGLMMRRNDAAFRLAVNRALAALYRSGEVVQIYEKWFRGFGEPTQAIRAMYLLNGLPE